MSSILELKRRGNRFYPSRNSAILCLLMMGACGAATVVQGQADVPAEFWDSSGPTCGTASFLSSSAGEQAAIWTALAYGGTAYRSTDRGRSWTAHGDFDGRWVRHIVFESSSPNRGYAATLGSGVFATADGGESWKRLRGGPATENLDSLAFDHLGRLYALSNYDGLWRSADDGLSWQKLLGGDGNFSAFAVEVVSPHRLFLASTAGGLLRSDDDGASWVPDLEGLPEHPWTLTWGTGKAPSLWATIHGNVYRRDPTAWKLVGSVGAPSVYAVLFDPLDDGRSVVGTNHGLYESSDGARTWQPRGLRNHLVRALLSLNDDFSKTILAGTDEGVYSSSNGYGWRKTSHGISHASVVSLAVSDQDSTVLAGTYECRGRIFSSPDEARTWRSARPFVRRGEIEEVPTLAFQPGDSSHAVGAVGGRIVGSVDRGRSWAQLHQLDPWIRALAFESRPSGWLFASTSRAVLRSRDGGASWETVLSEYPFDSFAGLAVAATQGGIWVAARNAGGPAVSFNSGDTWEVHSLGNCRPWAVATDPLDADTVYVSCGYPSSKLYRTDDRGRSWRLLSLPQANSAVLSIAVDLTAARSVLAVADGRIWQSCDKGANWQALPSPGSIPTQVAMNRHGRLFVGTMARGVLTASADSLTAFCPSTSRR